MKILKVPLCLLYSDYDYDYDSEPESGLKIP